MFVSLHPLLPPAVDAKLGGWGFYGNIPAGDRDWGSISQCGIIPVLSCLLLRTNFVVLLGSQMRYDDWRLDLLWSKVLSWPTPAPPQNY